MNDISEQRPDFFEGEYLAAADLEQLVIYLRDQSARHALGGHAWGIVAGLQLVEQTSPAGGLDVYLLPGYAVDGYGRAVIVLNPLRLTPDIFNGQPTGPVELWLRYDQGSTKGTRPGFEVCNAGDSYTRVAESYALAAGPFATLDAQSGITVAGEVVDDPRTAPRLFDDNGPIACDGSVPFQDLPLADETKSHWLIPLGWVGWQAGSPGQLLALSDDERVYSRRLRRYLGVVAESILAADGLIRLRRRTADLPVGQTVNQALIDGVCATEDVADPRTTSTSPCATARRRSTSWCGSKAGCASPTTRASSAGGWRCATPPAPTTCPKTSRGSVPLFLQRTDNDKNADLRDPDRHLQDRHQSAAGQAGGRSDRRSHRPVQGAALRQGGHQGRHSRQR